MKQKSLSPAQYKKSKKILFSLFFAAVGVAIVSAGALATTFPIQPSQQNPEGKSRLALAPKLDSLLGASPTEKLYVAGTQGIATVSYDSEDGTGTDCLATEERIALKSTSGIEVGYSLGGEEVTKVQGGYVCTEDKSILWLKGEGKRWEDPNTTVTIDTEGRLGINTDSSLQSNKLDITGGSALITAGIPTHAGKIADTDNASALLQGVTAIAVSEKYAYVTSGTENGVEILDINNPGDIHHVGKIADSGATLLSNPRDIVVLGKYAYVTSGTENGVEILNIRNPSTPIHAGKITDGDGGAVLSGAESIAVVGKYAYVIADNTLEIIDISDPSNPIHAGKIADGDGGAVLSGAEGIAVVGKYAYIAGSAVEIIDISDPTAPVHAGSVNTGILSNSKDIVVLGKYAYVAASGGSGNGLAVVSVSDPENPNLVGSLTDTASTALSGSVSVVVAGNYGYVTAETDGGVAVIDISDPANPTHVKSIFDDGTTMLGGASDIVLSGKYAYVTSASENGVESLDISGITAPAAEIGSIDTDTLSVNGNADVSGNLLVHTGLNVGSGGIKADGPMSAGSGTSYFSGKIGIGTTDPQYALEIGSGDINTVSGGYSYEGNCVGGTCASDRSLKTDITPLSGSLEKVTALQPVTFRFLDEKYGKEAQTGLIAQEVEKVFPEWVQETDEGYKGIVYGLGLEIHLIKALQELSENYEMRKSALIEENAQLKARLDELKNSLQKS